MLEDLETIDDDAEQFSVDFVKINDKRLAKSYGIQKFPALAFFRDEEMTLFEGIYYNLYLKVFDLGIQNIIIKL